MVSGCCGFFNCWSGSSKASNGNPEKKPLLPNGQQGYPVYTQAMPNASINTAKGDELVMPCMGASVPRREYNGVTLPDGYKYIYDSGVPRNKNITRSFADIEADFAKAAVLQNFPELNGLQVEVLNIFIGWDAKTGVLDYNKRGYIVRLPDNGTEPKFYTEAELDIKTQEMNARSQTGRREGSDDNFELPDSERPRSNSF